MGKNSSCERYDLDLLRYWGDTLMELEHHGYAFDSEAILKAMAVKLEKIVENKEKTCN